MTTQDETVAQYRRLRDWLRSSEKDVRRWTADARVMDLARRDPEVAQGLLTLMRGNKEMKRRVDRMGRQIRQSRKSAGS